VPAVNILLLVRARQPGLDDQRADQLAELSWAQRQAFLRHLTKGLSEAVLAAGSEVSVEDAQGNEVHQEAQKIRRLQIMVSMVMSVISQDPNLTVEEASELVAGTKRAALAMFPDKELAYDILYKPRLQRLMNERFRLQ
jgi:hypothetical protein